MGIKSTHNETNTTIMGQEPINKLSFDIYRAQLSKDGGSHRLELSNVISWELMVLKTTKEELKGLADFIYNYLENNTNRERLYCRSRTTRKLKYE